MRKGREEGSVGFIFPPRTQIQIRLRIITKSADNDTVFLKSPQKRNIKPKRSSSRPIPPLHTPPRPPTATARTQIQHTEYGNISTKCRKQTRFDSGNADHDWGLFTRFVRLRAASRLKTAREEIRLLRWCETRDGTGQVHARGRQRCGKPDGKERAGVNIWVLQEMVESKGCRDVMHCYPKARISAVTPCKASDELHLPTYSEQNAPGKHKQANRPRTLQWSLLETHARICDTTPSRVATTSILVFLLDDCLGLPLRCSDVGIVHLSCKLETGNSLLEMCLQWADHDEHEGLRVATERVLEEVC